MSEVPLQGVTSEKLGLRVGVINAVFFVWEFRLPCPGPGSGVEELGFRV